MIYDQYGQPMPQYYPQQQNNVAQILANSFNQQADPLVGPPTQVTESQALLVAAAGSSWARKTAAAKQINYMNTQKDMMRIMYRVCENGADERIRDGAFNRMMQLCDEVCASAKEQLNS